MPLLFLAPAMMAAASRKTSNVGMGSWLANIRRSYYRKAFEAGKIEVESISCEAARGLCFLSLDGDVKGLGFRVYAPE
jgi:hypothetical protein